MFQNFRRLFLVLDRWKWHYVISGVLLVLALFARSLEPKVLQIAADNVIAWYQSSGSEGQFGDDIVSRMFYAILPSLDSGNMQWVLIALGLIYLLISVLRGGFLLAGNALTAYSTERAIKHLRDRLFRHIQHLPLQYFTKMPKGDMLQRSTGDIGTVRQFAMSQIINLIRMVSIFGFSFLMMYLIHPLYALISVAFSPVLVIASIVFFRHERRVWEAHEEESDRLNTIVQENLNGIRTVQAFANEDFEQEKFDAQNLRKRDMGMKHTLLHVIYWPSSDFIVSLQIILTIVAGGYFAVHQQITIGELLVFYSYAMMVSWPMRQVGRVLSQVGMAVVAIERIYEILNAEVEELAGEQPSGAMRGEIEFRNVSFRYDKDASSPVIDDVSFKIAPGEHIAIVGPTGAGKSTLVKLLVGLYEPDTGEILVDGQNIKALDKQALRKQIGIVLQTPFLFSTSVSENIGYTSPGADEEVIAEAARVAQMEQLKEILVEGYNTQVGEKGVTLSGGQKQRVSLARTVLSSPNVLVLDDVTSAVDTHTEHAIFDALEREIASKTTLIISHRITSIQKADRILAFSEGRLVQAGTDRELERREGYYKDIHAVQSALEAEIKKH